MSKSERRVKTKLVHIRLTPEQNEVLKLNAAEAGCYYAADYIRIRCCGELERNRYSLKDEAELQRLCLELVRQGTNLNQIAKVLNGGLSPATPELLSVFSQLAERHRELVQAYRAALPPIDRKTSRKK